MNGGSVDAVESNGPLAPTARFEPGQLLAIAAVVAAVLFGLAGLIGAVGYLVCVSRTR